MLTQSAVRSHTRVPGRAVNSCASLPILRDHSGKRVGILHAGLSSQQMDPVLG